MVCHTRTAWSAPAPAPVWDSSHLTPPSPPPSGTFPSRPPSPSSCCYTLRISYLNPPHRAAVKNFPGRIICQPRILIFLGPPTYIFRVSRRSWGETGPTSLPSHSGQSPDVVVLARCHTDARPSLPVSPTALPLNIFFLFSPAYRNNGLMGLTSVPSRPPGCPIVCRGLCMHVPAPYRRSLRKTGIVPAVAPLTKRKKRLGDAVQVCHGFPPTMEFFGTVGSLLTVVCFLTDRRLLCATLRESSQVRHLDRRSPLACVSKRAPSRSI